MHILLKLYNIFTRHQALFFLHENGPFDFENLSYNRSCLKNRLNDKTPQIKTQEIIIYTKLTIKCNTNFGLILAISSLKILAVAAGYVCVFCLELTNLIPKFLCHFLQSNWYYNRQYANGNKHIFSCKIPPLY